MRLYLAPLAASLVLSGCYLPPSTPGYGEAQPGYPPGAGYGYTAPGYPPPSYDAYGNVYPGYSYNGGSPTLFVDGAVVPLVVVGGGWGYYDTHHDWHRAPDQVSRHLEQQRGAGNAAFNPGRDSYPHGPPPPGGQPYHGQPYQGQNGSRPPGQPPPPAGQPLNGQSAFHPPGQVPPGGAMRQPPSPQPASEARPEHARGGFCPPGQRC